MEASPGSNGSSLAVNGIMADPALTTTAALVAYLRMEADLAEEKAKRLRAQAAALSEQFGVTDEMQSQYELNPDQLPPMDENGVPKYRGKKRGRKPKPRKRKLDPNRRKRQHTAYTLFVQEIYPGVKAQHPDLPSKDVISIVAKQWKEFSAEEKKDWKLRAKATHEEEEEEDETEVGEPADNVGGHHHLVAIGHVGGDAEATAAADAVYQQTVAEMEVEGEDDEGDDEIDDSEEEEEEEEEEVEEEPEPPTRRRRGRPKKS